MITRELLVDAATQCLRVGFGSPTAMQRRIRVGFATAAQLLHALEDIQVVGPRVGGRHPLLRRDDLPAVIDTIDAAIADGRITLT